MKNILYFIPTVVLYIFNIMYGPLTTILLNMEEEKFHSGEIDMLFPYAINSRMNKIALVVILATLVGQITVKIIGKKYDINSKIYKTNIILYIFGILILFFLTGRYMFA